MKTTEKIPTEGQRRGRQASSCTHVKRQISVGRTPEVGIHDDSFLGEVLDALNPPFSKAEAVWHKLQRPPPLQEKPLGSSRHLPQAERTGELPRVGACAAALHSPTAAGAEPGTTPGNPRRPGPGALSLGGRAANAACSATVPTPGTCRQSPSSPAGL